MINKKKRLFGNNVNLEMWKGMVKCYMWSVLLSKYEKWTVGNRNGLGLRLRNADMASGKKLSGLTDWAMEKF